MAISSATGRLEPTAWYTALLPMLQTLNYSISANTSNTLTWIPVHTYLPIGVTDYIPLIKHNPIRESLMEGHMKKPHNYLFDKVYLRTFHFVNISCELFRRL